MYTMSLELSSQKTLKASCTYGESFQDYGVGVAEVRLCHVASVKKK